MGGDLSTQAEITDALPKSVAGCILRRRPVPDRRVGRDGRHPGRRGRLGRRRGCRRGGYFRFAIGREMPGAPRTPIAERQPEVTPIAGAGTPGPRGGWYVGSAIVLTESPGISAGLTAHSEDSGGGSARPPAQLGAISGGSSDLQPLLRRREYRSGIVVWQPRSVPVPSRPPTMFCACVLVVRRSPPAWQPVGVHGLIPVLALDGPAARLVGRIILRSIAGGASVVSALPPLAAVLVRSGLNRLKPDLKEAQKSQAPVTGWSRGPGFQPAIWAILDDC